MADTFDGDVAFIRALAELMRESDLGEIEVKREMGEDDALTVRLARSAPAAPAAPPTPAAPPMPAVAPVQPESAAMAPPAEPDTADPALHPGAVASPMVGTVYLQPEPTAEPFVRIGDQVAEGQTLLIIEAMKTMNQIPAPRAGVVRRILVEDGTPVEFGTPLMIIE